MLKKDSNLSILGLQIFVLLNGLCILQIGRVKKCSFTTHSGQLRCLRKYIQIQLGLKLRNFARVDFSMLLKER